MSDIVRDRLPLSPNELSFLQIVQEFWQSYHRSPSYRELQEEMDVRSKSSISKMVAALRLKGWLKPYPKHMQYALVLTAPVPPAPTWESDSLAIIASDAIKELEAHSSALELAADLRRRLDIALSRTRISSPAQPEVLQQ